MLPTQQTIHRTLECDRECVLECVWTPSGRGLVCIWVERHSAASAAAHTQESAADPRRKVA
jgi:hypothetical protein